MRVTKRPDERRREIIQAARELFAANGFMKTTISDIAERSGMAKGLFYYYFRTKDDVMAAAIEDYIAQTQARVLGIVRQTEKDLVSRIEEALNAIIDFSQDAERVFAELKNSDRYMFHQSILEHAVTRLSPVLCQLVDEGLEKGVIRCAQPHIVTEILFYGFGMIDFTNLDRSVILEIVTQSLGVDTAK